MNTGVKIGEQGKTPVSLRLRLIVLAAVVMAISLGLVGLALDNAFHKSSEAGLQARMESLVYLVLAATELDESGSHYHIPLLLSAYGYSTYRGS